MNNLKLGISGIDVEYLTYKLNQLGLYTTTNNLYVDSIKKAIISLQKARGLEADGIVGPSTWKSLDVNPNAKLIGKIKYIIIHCADTPEGVPFTYKDVYAWHTMEPPVGRGWKDIAYGILIGLDKVWYTRSKNLSPDLSVVNDSFYDPFIFSDEQTFGTLGHNKDAIDICYIGGKTKGQNLPKDTLTEYQATQLKNELMKFIKQNPDVLIGGHNQFANKACPSFDTVAKLTELGIPKRNILVPLK